MFSFLMCVNKHVPYLDEAIDSMLNQDYEEHYDIVIVANNCADDLWDFLHCKNKEFDGRLRLYRTRIGQLAFNLNYGLNLIESEYIVRMDADDISEPYRLSKLYDEIVNNDHPDVVGSSALLINSDGGEIGELTPPASCKEILCAMPYKNPMIHPSTAIKKDSLLKVKGYANGLNSEDYDLWLRMARAGCVFFNSRHRLLRYRINPHQVKGSRLAYAEGCGYSIRELLLTGRPAFFCSFFYLLFKFFIKLRKSH